MECLQTKLKSSIDDPMMAGINTLRIQVLKSKGTSCRLGIQKKWDSNVSIKLVGIGTFSNGTQVYELGNQYSYVDVNLDSVPDDNSTEIHITNAYNIISFIIIYPTLEVIDFCDLKYLSSNLQALGLISTNRYVAADEVLNSYEMIQEVILKGEGIILNTDKIVGLPSLTKFVCESEGITGNINNIANAATMSYMQIINSQMHGDLAMLPSGLKRIESTNQGEFAGNFSWSHRDASDKRFDIWRIDLGTSLDAMLVDMVACQANSAMEWGVRVYGKHTTEENIWRNAAQSLANSILLPVYVNGELFSAQN